MISKPSIKLTLLGIKPVTNFLKTFGAKLIASYEDGTQSKEFVNDVVDRKNLDAVVIIPYTIDAEQCRIYLRSSLRPAIALRNFRHQTTFPVQIDDAVLWELPAGLIEDGESPIVAGVRELREEIGFKLSYISDMQQLGEPSYPCVGLFGELLHFYLVNVTGLIRHEPTEDGSPFEKNGVVEDFEINELMQMIKDGKLADMKTEIGIRRFFEMQIKYEE